MMHWLIAAMALVKLAPVVCAQDTAKELFDAMEEKLSGAKTHKVDYSMESVTAGRPTKSKGTLTFAGNKLNWTYTSEVTGKRPYKVSAVCDGKTMVTKTDIEGKPERYTEAALGEHLAEGFIRLGLFAGLEAARSKNVKLSGFKLVGKEKVGDRQAHVIEYGVGKKDGPLFRLWLDASTLLPLRRAIEAGAQGKGFSVVETYTSWQLDPKLPDGIFTLPK
jgi:outer membrane lipoprotein-sorting protein